MLQNFGKLTSGTESPKFNGTQLCAFEDPELFFPENAKERHSKLPIARSICTRCAFNKVCLEYALANDVDGIWAGTTERERKKIRQQRNLPKPRSMAFLMDTFVK